MKAGNKKQAIVEFPAVRQADAEIVRSLAQKIWHECYPGIITERQIRYMLKLMYDAVGSGMTLCLSRCRAVASEIHSLLAIADSGKLCNHHQRNNLPPMSTRRVVVGTVMATVNSRSRKTPVENMFCGDGEMDKTDNKNISKALELARELIVLAKDGECESKDDGCMLLYGIVRDCGYRIDTNARKEKRIHESRVELR